MRMIALAAALVAAVSAVSFAADDMNAFFPKPQEIAGWVMTYDVQTYPGDKIYDFIDGAGEILMRYNFDTAAAAEYGGPDDASLSVEIYRMKTPEDAYGIYAYNIPVGASLPAVSQAAYVTDSTAGLWKDVYFVKVYDVAGKGGMAATLKEFVALISSRIPREGNLPDIFKVFDSEGFQKGTVKFLRSDLALKNLHFISEDNVLGLGEGVQMVFADFKAGDHPYKAFVITYPTEEKASEAAASYARFLGANPDATGAWYKQSGKAIVGAWTGFKQSESDKVPAAVYETIRSLLAQIRVYQLQK